MSYDQAILRLWLFTTTPQTQIEFVTGSTGPKRGRPSSLFPRPTSLNGVGRGAFFGISCTSSGSGPHPTHTPEGFPLQIGGKKQGPVQGMSVGGPRAGAGGDNPKDTPPSSM